MTQNKRLEEVIRRLVCPNHQCELHFDPRIHSAKGVPWSDSQISCPKGCIFEIKGGIPRFVSPDNYSSSFGVQWKTYRKTQLDSFTRTSYSRLRLEDCLGMGLANLNGKVVLECGSGAGRFTEHLIDNCESLVATDFSEAVEANLENCEGKRPYLLCQADINKSPLPRRFFDVVICIGVIQHTPSPEQTIASLADYIKPGGLLVIDHYTYRIPNRRLAEISRILSIAYPLRAILKRLHPDLSLKVTAAITAMCDPIRKRTCKVPWLDRVACRIFPSVCYYDKFPLLDPEIIYEWNKLDTYDVLTDYYKHFRSPEEIRRCLADLGFQHIECSLGGNGVQARAIYPLPQG